ncbi:MAG TPA: ABC transporter substrate-binding protein [Anaerolineae bacterium]|nr:ABC transporter substrate-binding protein [Anaerolineae bacterium]
MITLPPYSRYYLLLLLFVLTACTSSTAPILKIGLAAPFTGQHRAIGYDVLYSARLAIRDANATRRLGPYRLVLLPLDDNGDPHQATTTAQAFAQDPDLVAVIGHWLPTTTETASQIYLANNIPFVHTQQQSFLSFSSSQLPDSFLDGYAKTTPFDELAGPYAAPSYDATNLLITALEQLIAQDISLTPLNIIDTLENLSITGVSGKTIQSVPLYLNGNQ